MMKNIIVNYIEPVSKKTFIYKVGVSSCIWVLTWYICYWTKLFSLGVVISISAIMMQTTILTTLKVKGTIFIWGISIIGSIFCGY